MAIDASREAILPFFQVPDELPRRRKGRKIHLTTIYRWASTGCRGVVLESTLCGATRCTSREALNRFFERLTEVRRLGAGATSSTKPEPVRRSSAQCLRDSERAGRILEESGA